MKSYNKNNFSNTNSVLGFPEDPDFNVVDHYANDWLRQFDGENTSNKIDSSRDEMIYPLTLPEQSLWFELQLLRDKQNDPYVKVTSIVITGKLNPVDLDQAFGVLLAKMPNCRASFELIQGVPVKKIACAVSDTKIDWAESLSAEIFHYGCYFDFSMLAEKDRLYQQMLKQYQAKGMNLSSPNNIDYCLVRMEAQRYLLLIRQHQIAVDATGTQILIESLLQSYEEVLNGSKSGEIMHYYASVDAIIMDRFKQLNFHQARDYWEKAFETEMPVVDIPLDGKRSPYKSQFNGLIVENIDQFRFAAVKKLARKVRGTPFTVLLAIYQLLLHKLNSGQRVTVSTPINIRSKKAKNEVGYFINTLPIITEIDICKDRFVDLLNQVKTNVKLVFDIKEYPFSEMLKLAKFDGKTLNNPLTRFMMTYTKQQNVSNTIGTATFINNDIGSEAAAQDFLLAFTEKFESIQVVCHYDREIYSSVIAAKMVEQFFSLLDDVIAKPYTPVAELTILTPHEKSILLDEYNRTMAEVPKKICINPMKGGLRKHQAIS